LNELKSRKKRSFDRPIATSTIYWLIIDYPPHLITATRASNFYSSNCPGLSFDNHSVEYTSKVRLEQESVVIAISSKGKKLGRIYSITQQLLRLLQSVTPILLNFHSFFHNQTIMLSKCSSRRWLVFVFLLLAVARRGTYAEQNDDAAVANDDAEAQGDDAAVQEGDDYIKYWTDYAILPKRCIV
jgi:hypothetical protein